MSINIGNENKIKNTIILENSDISQASNEKGEKGTKRDSFSDKHPIITGVLISFGVGFVLLFSFWKVIIAWIESLF